MKRVSSIILGFACNGAVLFLGGVCILVMFAPETSVPTRSDASGGQGQVVVTGNGRRVRITAGAAAGDTSTELFLKDEENRSLITIELWKNGSLGYTLGGGPSGSAGYRSPDGTVGVSVRNARRRCSILAKPDGRFVLETEDRDRALFREFRVNPEGELVSEPPSAVSKAPSPPPPPR